jgi:hypothetical protein
MLQERRAPRGHRGTFPMCQEGRYASQQTALLLDHFVSNSQHARRDAKVECLGGLHVDDQLEFGRLEHWQIAGICALENTSDVDSDLPSPFRNAGALAHKAA